MMRRSLALLSLSVVVLSCGCLTPRVPDGPWRQGCVLAFSGGGIFALNLDDLSTELLVRQGAGTSYGNPAWSAAHGCFFFGDLRTGRVYSLVPGEKAQAVAGISVPYGWADMVACGDWVVALASVGDDRLPKLVRIAPGDGSIRVLVEQGVSRAFRMQAVDERTVVFAGPVEANGGPGTWLSKVDVVSGEIEDLFRVPGHVHVSPDGDAIVATFTQTVDGASRGCYLRGTPRDGFPEGARPMPLPTGTTGDESSVMLDDDHLLIWRQADAMRPLGTHVLDLNTGKAPFVCRARLWGATYLPDCGARGSVE